MSRATGRIEILPDPFALAHHVAEWMTQAALAAQGSFRLSLSACEPLWPSSPFMNRILSLVALRIPAVLVTAGA